MVDGIIALFTAMEHLGVAAQSRRREVGRVILSEVASSRAERRESRKTHEGSR